MDFSFSLFLCRGMEINISIIRFYFIRKAEFTGAACEFRNWKMIANVQLSLFHYEPKYMALISL